MAAALNAARPGRNADSQTYCRDLYPVAPDVVLLVWTGDRQVGAVWVTYSTCTGRGLDNGTRQAEVTKTLVGLIMDPLGTGYSLDGNLPY
jgi:hypothetical protein